MTEAIFNSESIAQLKELLQKPVKITITTHHKPDGDALGASLGWLHLLSAMGHQVKVVAPSEFPSFLNWMKGSDGVIDFIASPVTASEWLHTSDLVFCLDFNDPSRVENLQPELLKCTATMVLIDHHLDPKPGFCHLVFSYSSHASTSELIVHLAEVLGIDHHLNRDIAECLYAGIMTDTGSFRFNSVTSSTHHAVARLLDAGARNDYVHEQIYDSNTVDRLRFIGFTLLENMQILPEFATVIFTAEQKEMDRFNHSPGDLEGIVNYGLSITGMKVSVLFSERDGLVKISFRSKGSFSVKQIAEKYFSGGGHRNAAGGKFLRSMNEAVETFKKILPEFKDDLHRPI